MATRLGMLLLVLVGIVACMLAMSCAAVRTANAPAEPSQVRQLRKLDRRNSIVSYRTSDGQRHAWQGTVEPMGADSLLLLIAPEPEHGLTAETPGARLVLARENVTAIAGTTRGRAAVLFLIFTGLGFGAAMAQWSLY